MMRWIAAMDAQIEHEIQAICESLLSEGFDESRLRAALNSLHTSAHTLFTGSLSADPIEQGRLHDEFFSHVTGIWELLVKAKQFVLAEIVCECLIALGVEWEQTNPGQHVHKGTPFYFWGGTRILRGDIRGGFAMLHSALDEDSRKHFHSTHPDTPARKFVTLDTRDQNQYFYQVVAVVANELEAAIANYTQISRSSLTLAAFQTRFLTLFEVRELAFVFAIAISELLTLKKCLSQVGPTQSVSQLCGNTLLDLCVVIEEALRLRNGAGLFKVQAERLAGKYGWPNAGGLLEEVNRAQNRDFDGFIRNILAKTCITSRMPLSDLERDIWIAYAIRNATAHTLTARSVIAERFADLAQSVLSMLFAAIESFY
jgi:hypothetical protein